MKDINIACVFPSRGLVFTETLKELLDELKPYRHTIYWSHGNSLPDCFNKPLEKALRRSHSHIWMVEDDMVLTKGILKELLDADKNIISCDYPIAKQPSGTILYDKDDNAIFTGTGCMLAKRKVFVGIPKPVFRSDIAWGFKLHGGFVKFTPIIVNPDEVYGHHDITFGLYQYINREPIIVHTTTLAQRKLVKKGDNNTNNGADEIELFDNYRKINCFLIEEEKAEPEKEGLLTTVILDGKEVHIAKTTANRLLLTGVVKLPVFTHKNIIIDMKYNKKVIKLFKEVD